MKLLLWFILFSVMNVSGSIFSQSASFDLAVNGQTVKEVFKDIESQSQYRLISRKQEIVITGTVTDSETGETLIGVNVMISGTTTGTVTDIDGNYSISVPSEDENLEYSFIGYERKQLPIGDRRVIDVSLDPDFLRLDEVVVVGYGTVRRSDLTGSVERIDSEVYQNQSLTQITEMLTGTIAGLNTSQGARADGGGSMEIRGPTSLKARTDPLIVLDGVIYNGNIRDISPNDIESIDILKDASSAAVFGSRAASGVVIITTTKSRIGEPTINFSTNIGIAQVNNTGVRPYEGLAYNTFRRDLFILENPGMPDYYYHDPDNLPGGMSVEEWRNLSDTPHENTTREWLNRLNFYNDEVVNFEAGHEEKWWDRVMQTGLRQNYDLSIGGATESLNYYWSIGLTDNEGIQVGDEFSAFRTRLNVSSIVADFMEVGLNAQYANRDNSSILSSMGSMLQTSPWGNMYEDDGSVKWFPNGYTHRVNPLVNHLLQQRSAKVNSIFSTLYTDIDLPFGFSYRFSYQPRISFSDTKNFWGTNTPTGARSYTNGYGTRQDNKTYEWMIDNIFKWNQEFGIHNFDFTFIFNKEKYQSWSSWQSGEDFQPNEFLGYNALQFTTNYQISNNDNYHTGDALMARLNYTLNQKYLFTVAFRRDGYSAFGQENPRADFPSAAFAWVISDEAFYNFNLVDRLKIRTSWGVNGNREIGRYSSLARLQRNMYSDGSNVLMGVYNTGLANRHLRWERTEAFNIGVDFGISGGRLNGNIDFYHMITKDLLMDRNLPRITGFSNIAANLGELQNRGIELTLNSVNVSTADFRWNSNLVFSLNRNEIISLFGDYGTYTLEGEERTGELPDFTNEWFIGEAVDAVWDYKRIGVWQVDEAEEAAEYALSPGDYKMTDVNEDGSYTALEDKMFIGYRQPRYRIGFRNSFTISENFTASIFLRSDLGHIGSDNMYQHHGSAGYDRGGARVVPYWTAENPSDEYGSLTTNLSAYGGGYSVWFPRSYFRVQDVTFSYALPQPLYQRLNLQNLRLVGSIRNLYTITNWTNWDPESGGTPMPRVFTIGIDMRL